jgi:hypothetical protein
VKLIETKTLAVAAASIEFTAIPQDGTDLLILGNARTTSTGNGNNNLRFNGDSGSNYSYRMLYTENNGTPASAAASNTNMQWFYSNSANSTSNTFSNFQLYIPNYTSSTGKSVSMDHTTEHNGTSPFIQGLTAGLWTGTAAISSLLISQNEGNFVIGTTISLYKITKGSDGIVTVS